MREFTTVFWDVDGTLLDFSYGQRRALEHCFRSIGRELTEDILSRYAEINNSYWTKLELGEVTKAELLVKRFEDLFRELDITDVNVTDFNRDYLDALSNIYEYKDDSLAICKSLYGRVKQYVITNAVSSTQRKKLKLAGFAELMEELFISEEIGVPKPQKEFFDYCLEHIEEKDKQKILIVGDSLSSDIKGGINAGIPTCWYRDDNTENNTEYIPDYEISDLHRVYDVLGVFDLSGEAV